MQKIEDDYSPLLFSSMEPGLSGPSFPDFLYLGSETGETFSGSFALKKARCYVTFLT